MKRIVLIIIIFLSIMGISIYFINDNSPESVNTFKSSEEIQPTGYNSLALMLENEDGQYVLTDTDTWPTDGYVFNPDLSKCENGGTLSWNDGKITLKTSGSDKCYAYFDKYEPLKILSADVEAVEVNSVRLNSVSLNKKVQVSQYVVTITDPYNYKGIFKFTSFNQTVTKDSWEASYTDGCISFIDNGTYTYEIYAITNDGTTSEKYEGIVKKNNIMGAACIEF